MCVCGGGELSAGSDAEWQLTWSPEKVEPAFSLDVCIYRIEFDTTLLCWSSVPKKLGGPDAVERLICKFWQKQSVTSMTATLRNTTTTAGLELDQKEVLFLLFPGFALFLITIVVMQIVLNSCKLLVFKKICHEKAQEALYNCKCQWILHRWVTWLPNPTWWKGHIYIRMCSRKPPQPRPSLMGGFLHMCIPFWKQDIFLIYCFILTSLVPFFVSCTCLHCISHCPKRETILNVLSLLFYTGSFSFVSHIRSHVLLQIKGNTPPPPPTHTHTLPARAPSWYYVTVILQIETFIFILLIVWARLSEFGRGAEQCTWL